LKGKIMSGNPVFRGTRVPVHMLAELVPSRACARTRYRRGSVTLFFDLTLGSQFLVRELTLGPKSARKSGSASLPAAIVLIP
jgi:hypothetical protein